MNLQQNDLTREFSYSGMRLNDPAPGKSPEQVKQFYAMRFPELVNADIQGPVIRSGVATYTFSRAVGSKG